MPNTNSVLFAGVLFGALSLLSPAHAESDVGNLDNEAMTRFKAYVVQMNRPSYTFSSDLAVGTELPSQGVTYYEIPAEYGRPQYRYTIVNRRPVLVDAQTHRVFR
jgi:Protein of unknown function (DUF1236)